MIEETLIVVPLIDGVAQRDLAHLPATPIGDSIPYRAAAKCGANGVVYAKGGLFTDIRECPECQVAARSEAGCGFYASVNRYNEGCRCGDCKRVLRKYRKERYLLRVSVNRVCPVCGGRKAEQSVMCRPCKIEKQASEHGTNSKYARGCRCDLCCNAHREYQRHYRQRRKSLEEAA